jgi:hypothetical protein
MRDESRKGWFRLLFVVAERHWMFSEGPVPI